MKRGRNGTRLRKLESNKGEREQGKSKGSAVGWRREAEEGERVQEN